MATINISLPQSMYSDVKQILKGKRYMSISELVRDALRKLLYPNVTENGFTTEFENEVLKAEKEPMDNDIVLKTDNDVKNYFLHLKNPPKNKHAKN